MNAPSLTKLYESDLKQALRPPVAPGIDRRQIGHMLQRSRRTAPGALCEDDHATSWMWPDLHLGHAKSIATFRRPFKTADEMTDQIFSNWQQTVGTEDTIVILGDVTVHGLWGQRLRRVRERPPDRRSSCTETTKPPAASSWAARPMTKSTAPCTWTATHPYCLPISHSESYRKVASTSTAICTTTTCQEARGTSTSASSSSVISRIPSPNYAHSPNTA